MKIHRHVIVFDAADLAIESAFWAGLLGGTVVADEDWHSVIVDGEWRLGVQHAPNHVPPEWPDGMPQQQVHLDLHVDDLQDAHEKAIALGARLLQPAVDQPTTPMGTKCTRSMQIRPATRSALEFTMKQPSLPSSNGLEAWLEFRNTCAGRRALPLPRATTQQPQRS